MLKRESWAFLLIALAGILGFSYQQHSKALEFNRANCQADLSDRQDATEACDCFVEALDDEVSFTYSIPLVGTLLAPSDVKNGAVVTDSLARCGI